MVYLRDMAEDSHDDCPGKGNDFMAIGPKVEGGNLYVRHRSDCTMEVGTGEFRASTTEDGSDMPPGSLLLKPENGKFKVIGEAGKTSPGPAKANSRAFRDGWSRIFGGRQVVGQA